MKHAIHICMLATAIAVTATACHTTKLTAGNELSGYARQLLDSTMSYYRKPGTLLLNENYPKLEGETVTYLAGQDTARHDKVAYLWPTSGMLSAVNALIGTTGATKYRELLEQEIIPGLQAYYDTTRTPHCYQSYIARAGHSDRFYDDNVWLGIDFTESYRLLNDKRYLDAARQIWKFIESGQDSILGGGIYWCEQKKHSKNTCSNAPAAVLALKLYAATREKPYLTAGQTLYQWTKTRLQDATDHLYFDNIALDGTLNKTKFAYNSGQMLQAAALLYEATGQQHYLDDARALAEACSKHFFMPFTDDAGRKFNALRNGNTWFTAIMLRGFEELYRIDRNPQYLNDFVLTLQYACRHNPNRNKLMDDEVMVTPAKHPKAQKWLLTQAAMIEMCARLSAFDPAAGKTDSSK